MVSRPSCFSTFSPEVRAQRDSLRTLLRGQNPAVVVRLSAFAQGVGVGYNQIACNADVLPGIQRTLGLAGPILTHVIVSYEGREIRWMSAVRSHYIDSLSNRQKVRMAARIGVRTVSRADDSD